jgi:hypothetical protein
MGRLLLVGLGFIGNWGAVAAGACGGNVVVDGAATTGTGAVGGHGGGSTTSGPTATTSVTSTVATTGSTSSGTPPCACQFGKSLTACGLIKPDDPINEIQCGGLTSSAYACLCNAMPETTTCEALATCLGKTVPPFVCKNCAEPVSLEDATAWFACHDQQECFDIWNCYKACPPDQSCIQQCIAAHPAGQGAFTVLMASAMCAGPCTRDCAGTPDYGEICP